MSSAPVRPNRLARKPDTKTETKAEIKANALSSGRIAETSTSNPHQIFESRTPAKIAAKAASAPVATADSVPDSKSLVQPDTNTEAKVEIKANALSSGRIAETSALKPQQIFETRTPAKIAAKAASTSVASFESNSDSEPLPVPAPVTSVVPTLEPASLPDTKPAVTALNTHKRVPWFPASDISFGSNSGSIPLPTPTVYSPVRSNLDTVSLLSCSTNPAIFRDTKPAATALNNLKQVPWFPASDISFGSNSGSIPLPTPTVYSPVRSNLDTVSLLSCSTNPAIFRDTKPAATALNNLKQVPWFPASDISFGSNSGSIPLPTPTVYSPVRSNLDTVSLLTCSTEPAITTAPDTYREIDWSTAKPASTPPPPSFDTVSDISPIPPHTVCSSVKSTTIEYMSSSNTEPAAAAPDTQKRVSWTEKDLPVEFSSSKPPNEVSLALIGKTPTDPVDTITRNPGHGKATPVGEAPYSPTKDKNSSLDRQMFRCPSDGTQASLPVEPSELPASETRYPSVDGTFGIPAPEVAPLATPRVPRRSSLQSSNQPNITREHRVSSDAPSKTAHNKTETTALTSIGVDSQPPEFGVACRLSQSPRPLASRKEGIKNAGDSQRLEVYEDEEVKSEDKWLQLALKRGSPPPSPTLGAKAVLTELPVNTDIPKPKRRNSFSAKMTTDQNVNIHQTRQVIGRALPRMADGTLDREGFKHLRALIYKDHLWATGEEGQPVFDDLVQSLSFVVQGGSPYSDMDHGKLRLLRSEAMLTLNALLAMNRSALEKWSQHILRSVAMSFQDYPRPTGRLSHITLLMTRLANSMLELADQEQNLDTLLKLLESNTRLEQNVLALRLLTTALDKGMADVDKRTEARLGRLTCLCISDLDTDVRIAGSSLATLMFRFVKPESRFWQLVVDLSEEQKNLIAYYVSRPTE